MLQRLLLLHPLLDPNDLQHQQQQQQSQQQQRSSSMKDSSRIVVVPGETERRRSQVVSSTTATSSSLSSGALPVRIRANRRRIQDSVITAPPYDSFLLEHSTTMTDMAAAAATNATTTKITISPYITSPKQVYDYRSRHRHVIPLDEPLVYFITPTHNNAKTRTVQQQLADLTTLGQTLWLDGNVYWIVVEDIDTSTALNPHIRALLQRMGMPFAHVAARTKKPDPRMANHRGIDQRNRALNVVEELLTLAAAMSSSNKSASSFSPSEQEQEQGVKIKDDKYNNQDQNQTALSSLLLQQGVVYFGDDDNTYDVRILHALRQTKTVGILPVGLVGGGPYERCLTRGGRVYSIASAHKQEERPYPMDMAGFAFAATQLIATRTTTTALPPNKHNHDNTSNDKNNTDTNNDGNNTNHHQLIFRNLRFHWKWPGGLLETRFLEQMVRNVTELNPLADDCTKIYVWHTKSKPLTIPEYTNLKQQRKRRRQQQEQEEQQKLKQQEQERQKPVDNQEQAQQQQQKPEVNRQQDAQPGLQQPPEQQRQGQQDQPSQTKLKQVLLLQGDDDFVWNGGAGFVYNSAHAPVPQFPLRFLPPRPRPLPPKKDQNQTLHHADGDDDDDDDGEKEHYWDHLASRVGGIAHARPRRT
ncbi:hypothetical protein ACA910_008415 [Epithemia clementina (nom. ined.)]